MSSHSLFTHYKTTIDGNTCYFAGLPGYPRNFSRDTIIAGMLASDEQLLATQLTMSYLHQGKKYDHITGEEPGKIHHEYPGVIVHPPYLTTYNACDTTALYLIGLEGLSHIRKKESTDFIIMHQVSIELALSYLHAHIIEDIFWEFPPPGAKHFSLHTTYWKDSVVPRAKGGEEPTYPVAFALGHFQAARGILAAGKLLKNDELLHKADAMFTAGLKKFIRHDSFCVEQDTKGQLLQPSSDELHALAYIPTTYAEQLPLNAMSERALELLTPVGFACTPETVSSKLSDTYHGFVVWIFEQAMIFYGCSKFGLDDLAKSTLGCTSYIATGHELLSVTPTIRPLGNNHQLWSVAANIFFSREDPASHLTWL